jgi:hypothetical protein
MILFNLQLVRVICAHQYHYMRLANAFSCLFLHGKGAAGKSGAKLKLFISVSLIVGSLFQFVS